MPATVRKTVAADEEPQIAPLAGEPLSVLVAGNVTDRPPYGDDEGPASGFRPGGGDERFGE